MSRLNISFPEKLLLLLILFITTVCMGCVRNLNYSEHSPSISPDGKIMIFQSNRLSSGTYKIYVRVKAGKTWLPPVPLSLSNGHEGNTAGPFITYDQNYLLLSSDNKNGKGELTSGYQKGWENSVSANRKTSALPLTQRAMTVLLQFRLTGNLSSLSGSALIKKGIKGIFLEYLYHVKLRINGPHQNYSHHLLIHLHPISDLLFLQMEGLFSLVRPGPEVLADTIFTKQKCSAAECGLNR